MTELTGLGAIRTLDYVVLLCEEIEPMKAFYSQVLGFELRTEVDGKWAEMRVGSMLLALRLRSRPYDGPGPATSSANVQLAFRVPPGDVDLATAQLAELGIQLLEPPSNLEPFGHRAFFFADPENNVIEIYAEV